VSQPQDEQIVNQHTTSNEEILEQTPESSTQGQSEQSDENLPDKFAGKSAAEIAQAYKELERDRGRLASELGSTRKEREEMESRFRMLEQSVARYNAMPTQVPPPAQTVAEPDPFETFDQVFDEDPKRALKEALKAQTQLLNKRTEQQSMQQRAQEAQDFYWRAKKENPDYARREPIMQQLANEFQDVIRPEFLNSKRVLEALDLMSRGRDVDHYVKQAVATSSKNSSSVRQEKLKSQSESGSSDGNQTVDFTKMSSADMAKFLKRSED
jgi:hypothetical protein